jgi:hypothetical protein
MTSTLSFSLQSMSLVPGIDFTFNIPRDSTSFPRSTIFELYIFVLLDPFSCFCLRRRISNLSLVFLRSVENQPLKKKASRTSSPS